MTRVEKGGLLARLSLFVTLSLGSNGYVFGQADHGIHLVFVDRLLHPERWTGDFLDLAAGHHPSVLWWIEAGVSHFLGMPLAFFVLHVMALGATAWAIERLIRNLGGSGTAVIAGLLILAPAQFALGGVATLDPLLLPRGAALPIELLALSALCERRFKVAFFLLGLSACLHAPSAAGLAFASCVVLVLCGTEKARSTEEHSRSRELLSPLWFFVAASPVIGLWLLGGEQGAGLSQMSPEWLAIVDARLSHHIDPKSWPAREWVGMGCWLAAGGWALRSISVQRRIKAVAGSLILGLVLWAVLGGTLLARGLRLDLALQLEAWESFRFVTVISGCLLATWLGSLFPLRFAEIRWIRWLPRPLLETLAFVLMMGLSTLCSQTSLSHVTKWQPLGTQGTAQEFAEQAARVLPDASRILWPPQGFEYDRWRARTPGSPSWKDGGEALFDQQLARDWLQTMSEVCACNPLDFEPSGGSSRLRDLRAHLQESWQSRSAEELRASARKIDATHLVLHESQLHPGDSRQKPIVAVGSWLLLPSDPPN